MSKKVSQKELNKLLKDVEAEIGSKTDETTEILDKCMDVIIRNTLRFGNADKKFIKVLKKFIKKTEKKTKLLEEVDASEFGGSV